MKLSDYVEPDMVVTDIRPGDVRQILVQLVGPLVSESPEAVRGQMVDALLAREKVLSTGIGNGVAVPHAICDSIDRPRLIVGIAPDGVDFRAMDDAPVKLFFVLLSPPDRAGHHIRLLARIARMARHPEFVDALRDSADGPAVVTHIEQYEREHL
jgi:mannitol/fructose-specific phosphotransferase system IIA component (Ntr-type)